MARYSCTLDGPIDEYRGDPGDASGIDDEPPGIPWEFDLGDEDGEEIDRQDGEKNQRQGLKLSGC